MNLKAYSRGLLTFFGLLDAVLIGQYLSNVATANVWPHSLPIGNAALDLLKALLLVSLIFSAIGLCWEKRWAMLLSYAQFPIRLIFPLLSFGFLHQIPILAKTFGSQGLLLAAVLLEVARLVITIMLQRGGGKR